MLKITRDDIRGISDAASLLVFLREKLALPIAADATLEQTALQLPLPYLGLSESVAEPLVDCWHFGGLPGAASPRSLFLLRLKKELGYPNIVRAVSKALQQRGIAPAAAHFMCANEHFQPFALVYFGDTVEEDWQSAKLTIFWWKQENATIHVGSEHTLPANLFSASQHTSATADVESNVPELPVNEEATPRVSPPAIVIPTSSDDLLAKIENAGTPLGRHWEPKRSRGGTGCNVAFFVDERERQAFIGADAKNEALLRPAISQPQIKKWELEMKYLIFIPRGKFKRWPWSGRSESEAEQIFAAEYPAIHAHLNGYGDKVRTRNAGNQGEFYWELPGWTEYPEFQLPKIVYRFQGRGVWQAAYDTSGALMLGWTGSISTPDLSLLAILNSKLLDWYAHAKPENWHENRDMMRLPIADCTEAQKAELSELVQRILDSPRNSDVPELETEIDKLTYQLYGITDAERALIEARHPPRDAAAD